MDDARVGRRRRGVGADAAAAVPDLRNCVGGWCVETVRCALVGWGGREKRVTTNFGSFGLPKYFGSGFGPINPPRGPFPDPVSTGE